MSQPLVSVVTPSFNQGQYIEETILSVRRQHYPHVEHIIVDGGSTDETLDVIRRHEGTYNMRWLSEPDGGMYEAINKGLRLARGDILAYLNSDDRYFPWTVMAAARVLEDYPKVGFVFGDLLNVDNDAESGLLHFFPPFRLGYIRRWGYLAQPTVFWRRCVFEHLGGFDESLKFVADGEYWMRIGGHYRAYKLDEVLAIERNHPGAKRLAHMAALREELHGVRSRYVRTDTMGYRARRRVDQAYQLLSYRYNLARFLLAHLRRHEASEAVEGSWRAFLTHKDVRVYTGAVLVGLLPFTAGFFPGFRVRMARFHQTLFN